MGENVDVMCPWCGETMEIWVEPDARGTMIRDCDVCCRPWQLHVSWAEDGRECHVSVSRS
ncbi:MAG: CPXCG motif-containing cysteine-rich protein [Myxococcota bacterium]